MLVFEIPNKVAEWKPRWFFMEWSNWEYSPNIAEKLQTTMVLCLWGVYNEVLMIYTTQAKYSSCSTVMKIPTRERHYQVVLMENNINRYIPNLGDLPRISFSLYASTGSETSCYNPKLNREVTKT